MQITDPEKLKTADAEIKQNSLRAVLALKQYNHTHGHSKSLIAPLEAGHGGTPLNPCIPEAEAGGSL